jgi:predicted transcriptional regulator
VSNRKGVLTSAIGRGICRIRRGVGCSHATLAKLARTSQSWVCLVETGNANPVVACGEMIKRVLRVEDVELLRGSAEGIS